VSLSFLVISLKAAPNLEERLKVALKKAPNPLKGAKDKDFVFEVPFRGFRGFFKLLKNTLILSFP
jgi:hypothetical protein